VLAGFATAPAASAATNTSHFQQTVPVSCGGGWCGAKFPQLAANQALDIDHVACDVITDGLAVLVKVKLLPASLNFTYPLELQWQRKFLDGNLFTFGGAVNIRVPQGKQVGVEMAIGGTPKGDCSITGTKITQS
jgi:hypothetical protein